MYDLYLFYCVPSLQFVVLFPLYNLVTILKLVFSVFPYIIVRCQNRKGPNFDKIGSIFT